MAHSLGGSVERKPRKMELSPREHREKLYNRDQDAGYFYRVVQDVVAFKDKTVVNSYHHAEDFKDVDLRQARKEAIEYLKASYMTLPDGFIFPYMSPEEHNAHPEDEYTAYSHSILFVEFYSDEVFEEWPIAGEDEPDTNEGLEHENEIWLKKGLGQPPHITPVI
jgi:hypothetical protein